MANAGDFATDALSLASLRRFNLGFVLCFILLPTLHLVATLTQLDRTEGAVSTPVWIGLAFTLIWHTLSNTCGAGERFPFCDALPSSPKLILTARQSS